MNVPFAVGDDVRLYDPGDENTFLEGKLVPWAEVPSWFPFEPGSPSFNSETGHFDGPPQPYDQGYLTVFGIYVGDQAVAAELDVNPYPVDQYDLDGGWLRRVT